MPDKQSEIRRLRKLAAKLKAKFDELDEDDLGDDREFRAAVARLASPELPIDVALALSKDREPFAAALGLAALAQRPDVPADWTDWAIRALRRVPGELESYVFGALEACASYPAVGPALTQIDEGIRWDELARFISRRQRAGEIVDIETFRRNLPLSLADEVASFIDAWRDELGSEFCDAFEEWRRGAIDIDFVRQFARIWERPFDRPPTLLVGRRRELVETIVNALRLAPRRSVLLVGEHGVGKTAVVRAALERLPPSSLVLEATAAQVHAGAAYVGELETRVKEIVDRLKGRDAVWVFPGFEAALYSGQHSRSPMGLLDSLLPHIESGELTLVAEVTPAGLERLLAERPRVASAFDTVRILPLDESDSISVAHHALDHDGLEVAASDGTLTESFELAQHFLPGAAAPGNVLKLVAATAAEAAEQGQREFDTAAVLATLAAASGLPLHMLDPNELLQLGEVRTFFEQRVLGQPEAIDCLVERIAMAKAGLTDPTRPLGVFLFVGPTGTGKTEIAKALAEYLFGSPGRLVRLDMSEFQTQDSLERLLSDVSVDRHGAVLVSSVRKDPFSVVLLDEFEKAAAPIRDLFLQVFDDGRLTDQHGRLVDFRRCVIVLTSNIGSAIARGSRLGFTQTREPFRPEKVYEALRKSFRPEFLNRIDRVVVFRPFEREQMRDLLDKELGDVLARRGLRSRPWAVELDDSAYEFIIEQGFSPELGARPLKRAVERHLLAPLAEAIVEQTVPEGDQFLLVSAPGGERIAVTFIDPDAEDEASTPAEIAPETVRAYDLRSLALAPRADEHTTRFLLDELTRVASAIDGDVLRERKHVALSAINEPGFWELKSRFATLAEAEYLDRLDAAVKTAVKLGERLARHTDQSGRGSLELVELLAGRLYVLDSALAGLADAAPTEVFLRVRPAGEPESDEAAAFAELLVAMYAGWAERRGMRLQRLAAPAGEHLLEVWGLGCGAILAPEAGLHLLELRDGGGHGDSERAHALVEIAACEPGPQVDRAALARRAREALERQPANPSVVRRYRREPTGLARDAIRGYRTGRLDRVLAGDFDLF